MAECGFKCWKHNGNKLIKNYCAIFNNKCLCNPDCYFKQLQRLKQENEELKYKNDRQKDTIIYLNNYDMCHKTLIQYKQALEEIREILCQGRTFYEGYFDREPLTRVDTAIKKINEVLNEK